MKKHIFVFLSLAGLFTSFSFAQTGKLTVNFSFVGVKEGYDHETKCTVFVDDREIGSSKVKVESKANKFKVKVPLGEHKLTIMNYANYEGNWEEHTKENEYSLDAFLKDERTLGKKGTVSLVFDIDAEETTVTWE